ncbi:FHA-domain-containing protein [Enhygromyxa salina]|uniref:FHA-domain-containing protein n=1 Tax=Enhygromyxa salina TaxID=215803 RepID=A0A0C2D7V8_9BACT|nr:FHA domain-containing protein [Enhygromyxa salina]KIG16092.1 FHA-domain-containing protein [Enhygromyxa salina]
MRLIIEDLEGATTVVNLGTEEVTIGRRPHNTIQLTEQNVSRSHAKLNFQDEGWLIHDLGSYNGVKVNGVPINQPTQLRESDLIQIGDYHLTLTDNVDRQTVDVERPRAANDNYGAIGAMGSSSDLPSMSVEDLGPMRGGFPPAAGHADPNAGYAQSGPGQAGYAGQSYQQPPEEEEKKNKAGLIIGIVGALAAVLGIGLFLASNAGDKPSDKDKGEKKALAGDPVKQDDGQAQPLDPDSGPEIVPEVADDAGAAVTDDGAAEDDGGDEGELVAETGAPEPEPEPKPKQNVDKPKPKPKPPAEPKLPPAEALTAARKASMTGDNKKAYSLAKDAYDQNQSGDALNLMGVAACKMGSASKAKAAYTKMTSKDKATLEKICGPLGIEL